jgi:hypothetical protein
MPLRFAAGQTGVCAGSSEFTTALARGGAAARGARQARARRPQAWPPCQLFSFFAQEFDGYSKFCIVNLLTDFQKKNTAMASKHAFGSAQGCLKRRVGLKKRKKNVFFLYIFLVFSAMFFLDEFFMDQFSTICQFSKVYIYSNFPMFTIYSNFLMF